MKPIAMLLPKTTSAVNSFQNGPQLRQNTILHKIWPTKYIYESTAAGGNNLNELI